MSPKPQTNFHPAGPPGVGKSSAARIVAAEFGYDVVELNASDVRNKKGLREYVSPLTSTKSLASWCGGADKQVDGGDKKTCLIMDEV